MRYSEIKTMGELDAAREEVKGRLDRREFAMRESLLDLKESLTPSNMFLSGLRSLSAYLPVEKMLLVAVRALKRKLFR